MTCLLTLKMESASSQKVLLNFYRTTRCHIRTILFFIITAVETSNPSPKSPIDSYPEPHECSSQLRMSWTIILILYFHLYIGVLRNFFHVFFPKLYIHSPLAHACYMSYCSLHYPSFNNSNIICQGAEIATEHFPCVFSVCPSFDEMFSSASCSLLHSAHAFAFNAKDQVSHP